MHSPIGPLLQTVFLSILEVFLVAFSGYVLARQGVLDRRTQRQINRFNIALFTPSLIFSKVAFTLSPAKFKELWIVPIFFVALTFVSGGVAWGLAVVFRLKPTQKNFAIAAAMFMNSNSLPIALLQSLVVSVPGLNWGDDDTTSAKVGRALTYLTLCSTIGMVFRWSIGVRLLTTSDPPEIHHDVPTSSEYNERTPLLIPEEPESASGVPAISVHPPHTPDTPHQSHVFYSFPNTPANSGLALAANGATISPSYPREADYESESDSSGELLLDLRARRHRRPQTFTQRVGKTIKTGWTKFTAFMTAPLYASLLSIGVALWPALQHTLNVHITPVKAALTQLGACSIPLTLVVLGAYFYTPKVEKDKDEDIASAVSTSPSRPSTSWWARSRSMFSLRSLAGAPATVKHTPHIIEGESRTVFVAVLSRMIIVPALFLPLFVIGAKTDVPPVFEDPVFMLSLVLLLGSPPAITLSQMTQAVAGDAFERLISRTIFWSYCIVTPPSTVVLSLIAMLLSNL